jgi:hypothetical protein
MPDNSPKTLKIAGQQQRDTIFLHFNILEKSILAQKTGKLERLMEGPDFKKNDLLVQYDDYDAFVELSGAKESLKEEITNQVINFPKSLQPVADKWRNFAASFSPDKMIPKFPKMEYKEEVGFIESTTILEQYQSLQKKEVAIKNYFQVSSEAGFITETLAKSTDYVKKNKVLIHYQPKKITVVAKADFPLTSKIQTQIATNFSIRVPIEKNQILQKKEKQINYLLTLNQKIDPKMCPKYVIINQDQNSFTIPKEYIGADGTVLLSSKNGTQKEKVSKKNGAYFLSRSESTIEIKKP